jgi:hypothetical protein
MATHDSISWSVIESAILVTLLTMASLLAMVYDVECKYSIILLGGTIPFNSFLIFAFY